MRIGPGGGVDFFKRQAGIFYGPYNGSGNIGITTNTWYTIKLEVAGSTFKAYVDGILRATWTDSTFTSGKIGLRVAGTHAYFDDVKM